MGKKLYVGNLPYTASEDDLQNHFSQAGGVDSVKLVTDRDSGRSKGFAFVEMTSDDDASKAIEQFNGNDFMGRNMIVNEARPQEPRSGGGGGGRRDSGGSRGPRY